MVERVAESMVEVTQAVVAAAAVALGALVDAAAGSVGCDSQG